MKPGSKVLIEATVTEKGYLSIRCAEYSSDYGYSKGLDGCRIMVDRVLHVYIGTDRYRGPEYITVNPSETEGVYVAAVR
jgi:hypothetical protein